jgi:hypothetical protein
VAPSIFAQVYNGAAQQLAAADPAGVRKVGEGLPAWLRENGPTVSRAAGQLPVHSMGHAPQRTRETCPQGGFPTPEGWFPGLEVVGRRPFGQAVLRRRPGPLSR